MAAHAMPREEIFALRQAIARIEGKSIHAAEIAAAFPEAGQLAQGEPADGGSDLGKMEQALEAILREACQPGSMTEIRSLRLGEAGAASGFGLALALCTQPRDGRAPRYLVIGNPMVAREAGLPYAPGLADFGLGPRQLIHALPRRIEDALWLADAALACQAFTSVLLEIHGNSNRFGLTESRRLALKVRDAGGSLIVIRQAGEEEASSASLRLKVQSAPAAARSLADGSMLGGSIGNPVFRILAEKSRSAALSEFLLAEFLLEWNIHDRRLRPLPAAPATQPGFQRAAHSGALFSPAGDRSTGSAALGSVLAFDRAS